MARKRKSGRSEILPDPKHHSIKVTKFINCIMMKGKKSVAEKIVYGALEKIGEKTQKEPLEVFLQALDNVRPIVKVVSKRVGGQNYQVPLQVTDKAGQAIAFRWVISFSKKRSEKSMTDKLAGELLSAYNKEGASIKKREDTHKMAESNKAFAHLRW